MLQALRNGSRPVGLREELSGDVAGVADLLKSAKELGETYMPRPGVPAVGVRHVEVEDPVSADPDALGHVRFFDVHVEDTDEQPQGVVDGEGKAPCLLPAYDYIPNSPRTSFKDRVSASCS